MASDIFLEITSAMTGKPIKAESMSKEFPNHIEVTKFTIGATSPEDYSTKQATGKPHLDDVEFEFPTNAASAILMTMLTTNEQIKVATLKVRKAGPTGGPSYKFLEWRFKNARITSFKQTNESEKLVETIRIGYSAMEWEYAKQKGDGSLEGAMLSGKYDGNQGK